jgi:hypothetical protein
MCFYQFEVVFCRQDADDLEALLVGWAWAFFASFLEHNY